MKSLLPLLLLILSSSASAEMFRCEVNGKKVYQGFPCESNSVVIKEANKPSEADVKAANNSLNKYRAEKAAKEIAKLEQIEKHKEQKKVDAKNEILYRMDQQDKNIEKIKKEADRPRYGLTQDGDFIHVF